MTSAPNSAAISLRVSGICPVAADTRESDDRDVSCVA
jgi:hypothetical protein